MDTVRQNTATLVEALLADGDADDGLTPEDLAPALQPNPGVVHGGEPDKTNVDTGTAAIQHNQTTVEAASSTDEKATADAPGEPAKPDRAAYLAAGPVNGIADAVTAQTWIRRGGQPTGLLARLAEDPSARVRMAVAARIDQAAQLAPEEAQLVRQLEYDQSFNVRAALAHPLPAEQS